MRIKPHRISQIIATIIQNSFIPTFWIGVIYQGPLKKGCIPVLNCWGCPLASFSCPMGALQHFFTLHLFPFYIIGFFGTVGMLTGRMVCGWLCPFGLFQDFLHKLKTIKLKLPYWLSYIKYAVLIGVAGIIAWISLEPWFCKLCPAGILEAGIPMVLTDKTGDIRALVGWLFWTKLAILAGVVIFSILIKRFFCRTCCPIGAIYSVFNRFSLVTLKIDKEKCQSNCRYCSKICPMDIDMHKGANQKDCIRCLECVYLCPNKAINIVIR